MKKEFTAYDRLVVIDMQHDFIDGSLGSDAAKAILPKVVDTVLGFPGRIIATKDTHGWDYLKSTLEGARLPVEHCIIETAGWTMPDALDRALVGAGDRYRCVHKHTFGYLAIKDAVVYLTEDNPFNSDKSTIYICGLCTDICVVSNALILRAAFPDTRIVCLQDLCACTSPMAHDAALKVMASCQIDVE